MSSLVFSFFLSFFLSFFSFFFFITKFYPRSIFRFCILKYRCSDHPSIISKIFSLKIMMGNDMKYICHTKIDGHDMINM